MRKEDSFRNWSEASEGQLVKRAFPRKQDENFIKKFPFPPGAAFNMSAQWTLELPWTGAHMSLIPSFLNGGLTVIILSPNHC